MKSTILKCKNYRPFKHSFLGLIMLLSTSEVFGQSYINQSDVEEILENYRAPSVDLLPEVFYNYYVLSDKRRNTVLARNTFYKRIGKGNLSLGRQRSKLVELLNRVDLDYLAIGDTLVIPT